MGAVVLLFFALMAMPVLGSDLESAIFDWPPKDSAPPRV